MQQNKRKCKMKWRCAMKSEDIEQSTAHVGEVTVNDLLYGKSQYREVHQIAMSRMDQVETTRCWSRKFGLCFSIFAFKFVCCFGNGHGKLNSRFHSRDLYWNYLVGFSCIKFGFLLCEIWAPGPDFANGPNSRQSKTKHHDIIWCHATVVA